jgi:hypothetical protein
LLAQGIARETAATQSSKAQVEPRPPSQECDDGPRTKPSSEGSNGLALDNNRERYREGEHSETAERGTSGIKRCRLLASPMSGPASLPFAALLVRLNQGGACAEDGGQGEKQAADSRPEPAACHSCENRRAAA